MVRWYDVSVYGKGHHYVLLKYAVGNGRYMYIYVLYMHTCVQVILRADKTTNNFSDRAILKNLGHWLGMQTLAKNKAILQNVRFYIYMWCSFGKEIGLMEWGREIDIEIVFRAQDLAVKNLVREAHYKGEKELLYVVPFVAKVLESCAESRVFKPPNPWTMAIMSVLSELHSAPDLKLNLRFEVEVLCKHLNMEIAVSVTQLITVYVC